MLSNISGYDYGLATLSLMVPAFLSAHCAWFHRQRSLEAHAMAARGLGVLPAGLALTAAFITSDVITATPGEIASRGLLSPVTLLLGATAGLVVVPNLFIPIFYKMRLTSVFEYLELRYNSVLLRRLASASHCVALVGFTAIAVEAPASSVHALTGLPVFSVILLVGIVGTFYTAVGGLRGVVWASAFQSLVVLSAAISTAVVAVNNIDVGGGGGGDADSDSGNSTAGFAERFSRAMSLLGWSGRARWADPDPTPFGAPGSSTPSALTGAALAWAALMGGGQAAMQRFCATKSPARARGVLLISLLFTWLLQLSSIFAGIAVYAHFWRCHAHSHARAHDGPRPQDDDLSTVFVVERALGTYGMPGIFIAGILSAALSCLSAGLNSVSTLLMEDFLRDLGPFRHSSSPYASNFTLGSSSAHAAAAAAPAAPAAAATTRSSSPAAVDERRVQACRGATVALGILSSALACLIAARRQRGDDGFPELGWATLGAAAGPSLALFMLGFFTATANKMGALLGLVMGQSATVWLLLGRFFLRADEVAAAAAAGGAGVALRPFAGDGGGGGGCSSEGPHGGLNGTGLGGGEEEEEVGKTFFYVPEGDWQVVLYSVNPDLYPLVGFLLTLLATLLLSLATRACCCYAPRPVERLLLHPLVRYRVSMRGVSSGKAMALAAASHASKMMMMQGGTLLGKSFHSPPSMPPYRPSSSALYEEEEEEEGGWHHQQSMMGYDVDVAGATTRGDTHYRWPSPSLPPTLKKNQRSKNVGRMRGGKEGRETSDNTTADDLPSEETAESTGGSASQSGGSTKHSKNKSSGGGGRSSSSNSSNSYTLNRRSGSADDDKAKAGEDAIDVVDDDFGTDLEQVEEVAGQGQVGRAATTTKAAVTAYYVGSTAEATMAPGAQKTLSRQNIIRTCEREEEQRSSLSSRGSSGSSSTTSRTSSSASSSSTSSSSSTTNSSSPTSLTSSSSSSSSSSEEELDEFGDVVPPHLRKRRKRRRRHTKDKSKRRGRKSSSKQVYRVQEEEEKTRMAVAAAAATATADAKGKGFSTTATDDGWTTDF